MGGKSGSDGGGVSKGMTQSYIDPSQKKYLQGLWGTASSDILNNGTGQANQGMQDQFLGMLQNNPMMSSVQQFADPNNSMVGGQLNQLQLGLNDQFKNVLMPAIGDQAIQGGGLGGSRQGVAQGLASQGIQQAYGQGAQGILSNAYNQAQQASQFGAGLLQSNAISGLQGLGQAQQQQFAPLMALAQILGNPTVLQRSTDNAWNKTGGGSGESGIFGMIKELGGAMGSYAAAN